MLTGREAEVHEFAQSSSAKTTRMNSRQWIATDGLNEISFDRFLERQNPFDHPDCVFDLRGFRFITPAGLAQLAAACYAVGLAGRKPIIRTSDNTLLSYLARSEFLDVVGRIARFEPTYQEVFSCAPPKQRGDSRWLIELTQIQDESCLGDFLGKVIDVLRHRLRYHRSDAYRVATLVSEICQNTLQHNTDTYGFFAMQVYRHRETRLELALADFGNGLAATLRQNPKNGSIPSDLVAIRRAIELGSSRHDDPTHGTGLYHLFREANEHGGTVQIRSGGAKMRFTKKRPAGWEFTVAYMPGVQIALMLPAEIRP